MDWVAAFQQFFLIVYGPLVVLVLVALLGASGVLAVYIMLTTSVG